MFTYWHVPLLNLLIRLFPKGPECLYYYEVFPFKSGTIAMWFICLKEEIYFKICVGWTFLR